MFKELVGKIGRAAETHGPHAWARWRGRFPGSNEYWVRRYRNGRNSGGGSYGRLAEFKARILNEFVAQEGILSVIEFGCGDGNQLALAAYPSYVGFDISPEALDLCRTRFRDDATKAFRLMDDYAGECADLSLSLDVIYHLIEDEVFAGYLRRLFTAGTRHVVIYSSNVDARMPNQGKHVRHRRFTDWVAEQFPQWKLERHVPNEHPFQGDDREGSFADFFFYSRKTS